MDLWTLYQGAMPENLMSYIRVTLKCIRVLAALWLLGVVLLPLTAANVSSPGCAEATHNSIVLSLCLLLLTFWLEMLVSASKISRLSVIGTSLCVLMLIAGACWGLCTWGDVLTLHDCNGHTIRLMRTDAR